MGTLSSPPAGGASDAASVSYDNAESEAEAENLQEAADELFADKLDETAHDALDHTGLTGVGGITNGAGNTQIAVSDGTNLTGSPNLTWNEADRELGLEASENGGATIESLGVAAQLLIRAADGDVTHVGGELTLLTGASAGEGISGVLTLVTGGNTGTGDSGDISIQTGNTVEGQGGDISLQAGGQNAIGGSINLVAGTGQTGDGGSVIIQAGYRLTGGDFGSVQLYSGDTEQSMELGTAGISIAGSKIGFYDATPATQPAAVADATDEASAVDRLNELLARLRTLGLIDT